MRRRLTKMEVMTKEKAVPISSKVIFGLVRVKLLADD